MLESKYGTLSQSELSAAAVLLNKSIKKTALQKEVIKVLILNLPFFIINKTHLHGNIQFI